MLLVCASGRQRERATPGITFLSVAVAGYTFWVVVSNALTSPAYTAAAPFHAAFLVGGFALGRGLDRQGRQSTYMVLAAGAALLAVWALWQLGTGVETRGLAHFETPNTLATVLNLVLAPALVLIASGVRSAFLVALAVVLAAGVAATLSRGGFLALAFGLLAASMLARRARIALDSRGVATAVLVLAAGWALAAAAPLAGQWLPAGSGGGAPAAAHDLIGATGASYASRSELYGLAASGLEGHWGLGIGYLGFNALLEAGRQAVPSYGTENVTYFAHNDYLQTLVELGLPGLAIFVSMIGLPFWLAWRGGLRASSEPRVLVAALAALATMATHAAVDFPFYVPLPLLLFGLVLGASERMLAPAQAIAPRWRTPPARIAGMLIGAGLAVLLLPPVAAEAAAAYGNRKWQASDGQAAAYWFEVARRFQPRDWRYHWYVGQFWLAQTASNRDPVAARLADEAFAAGFAANPREPRNLLGRIATQRQFGTLLAAPADAATMREWADTAVGLAPLNARAKKERDLVLEHLARRPGGAAK